MILQREVKRMVIDEITIDRWLVRGTKFLKTIARNPVVRSSLFARGLTDEELERGWGLYSMLIGFNAGGEARPATRETDAAQAMNQVDAWDAPAYLAAHAVLDRRYPAVSAFLFDNLEASTGVEAVVGVERFLDRIDQLRAGTAPSVDPEQGRSAVQLLATRKIIDEPKEADLRALIATTRRGARPDEVIEAPTLDPNREKVATEFIEWMNEWREVARLAIANRAYRISLGLARRRKNGDADDDTDETDAPAAPIASGG
jgi:hypothetical protein